MRLVDFNLSVAELDPHLKLFVMQNGKPLPISSLELMDPWLIVIPGMSALTLDQFETRTKTVSGRMQLGYLATRPRKLFGYHLRNAKLILG